MRPAGFNEILFRARVFVGQVQRGNRDRSTMNMNYTACTRRGGYRGEESGGEEEKLKERRALVNEYSVALRNNLPQTQTIDEAFQMN